jgi:hypothetical protein
MAPKTNTCPIGVRGIIRIITTGMNVMISLNVRLKVSQERSHEQPPSNNATYSQSIKKTLPQVSHFPWL